VGVSAAKLLWEAQRRLRGGGGSARQRQRGSGSSAAAAAWWWQRQCDGGGGSAAAAAAWEAQRAALPQRSGCGRFPHRQGGSVAAALGAVVAGLTTAQL
jgi:hypothetical protein